VLYKYWKISDDTVTLECDVIGLYCGVRCPLNRITGIDLTET